MKKRLLSLGMALCMVLTLVPISAFAEENSGVQTCICEAVCTEETRNTDCPVCGAEGAALEDCGKYVAPVTEMPTEEANTETSVETEVQTEAPTETESQSEPLVCICEAVCAIEAMNADCSVCGAEGATIENCGKYEAPVEETKPEQTAVEKVQVMLDALPTVEELEAAEEATVNAAYEAAQDAYDALEALNPEEQEQITGVEKLMTLMKWFNEKTSMTDGVYYYEDNVHGIEHGKTYCGDTYFTVDIPAEHLVQVQYFHKASGTYPVLKPDEDGRYKLDAGLGEIDVSVHWDNKINHGSNIMFHGITIKADHADIDKDHNCENGCGKTVGTHVDADLNHICDYGCKEAIGICADADKDHKCDYGCGKNFGTHVDADLNHICDYGCKEAIGICADADKDHKCDYGCGKNFGTHEDADLNHICDYGCDEAIGICADADKDHKCDYGCGKTFGVCSGGTATCKDKAVCDYCGKPYGELDSSNHAGGTEVRNAKAATCTEDGYTGDTYCKGCETKLSSGKSVDKTGHDYESKVTKEATTTSTGTKTYTCKNCGHSYEEEIAKLPSQSTSPKTGDETPLVATIVVTLLSAAALIVLVTYKKRGRYSAK